MRSANIRERRSLLLILLCGSVTLALGGAFFNAARTATLPSGPTTPTSLLVTLNKVLLQSSLDGPFDGVLINIPTTVDVVGNLGRASALFASGSVSQTTFNGVQFTLAQKAQYSGPNPCDGSTANGGTIYLPNSQNGVEVVQYQVPHPIKGMPRGAIASQTFTTSSTPLDFRLVFPVTNSIACIADSPPLRTIAGTATGIAVPISLYVDATNNEIGVSNSNNSITVFHRTDNGNIAPQRVIQGGNTALNGPQGIYVDTNNDEIGVANNKSNSIAIYSRTANGDVPPLRTIIGSNTFLNGPGSLFLDKTTDEIFVANNDSITVYGRTDSGPVSPHRTIQGSNTGLQLPCGVYVDEANSEIAVTNNSGNSVVIYGSGDSGNVTPLRTISGPQTGLSAPCGVLVDDASNEIIVTNAGNNSITYYNRTSSGNVYPLKTIEGVYTGINVPTGLYLNAGELGVVNNGGNSVIVRVSDDSSPHLLKPPVFIDPTIQKNFYANYKYTGYFDKVTGAPLTIPTFQGYGFNWHITDPALRQPGDVTNGLLIPPQNVVFGMADGTTASNLTLGCNNFTPFITLDITTACSPQPLIMEPFPPAAITYRVAGVLFAVTTITDLTLHIPPLNELQQPLLQPTLKLTSAGSIQNMTWRYINDRGDPLLTPLLYSQNFQVTLNQPYTAVNSCYKQVAGNSTTLVFDSGPLTPDVQSMTNVQNNGCDIHISDVSDIKFTSTDAYGNSYAFTWNPQ